jgi:hypothetical protein
LVPNVKAVLVPTVKTTLVPNVKAVLVPTVKTTLVPIVTYAIRRELDSQRIMSTQAKVLSNLGGMKYFST